MNDRLWDDITAQGDNLAHVVDHLYGPQAAAISAAAASLDPAKPTLLVGMGSAAYLSMTAETYLGSRGIAARVVYASDAIHYERGLLRRANVIVNSRSGETIEIVQLAEHLRAEDITFTAITNAPESTLAQSATHVVWTDTRADDLVSINVVTGMMTGTLVVAAAVAGEMAGLQGGLALLPEKLQETVRSSAEESVAMGDLLQPTRPIYVLSRGISRGAAYCARLVLEEVARHPAVALEASEFRQGPIEVVDDQFGALIMVPADRQAPLSRSLGQDILDSGGRVLFVGDVALERSERSSNIPLPETAAHLRPILEVVPAQVLAHNLAARLGITPGTVRYISKFITTETGIPNASAGTSL